MVAQSQYKLNIPLGQRGVVEILDREEMPNLAHEAFREDRVHRLIRILRISNEAYHPTRVASGDELAIEVLGLRVRLDEMSRTIQAIQSRQDLIDAQHARMLKTTFRILADEWYTATGMLSSISQKVTHPAYLRIIGMGHAVLPLLLEELRNRGGDWYDALDAITREDPVPPDAYGDISRMKALWIDWGLRHGHLS